MNTNKHESADLVLEAVDGAAYEVSNVLGAGFLEKVYERALVHELTLRGFDARPQVAFPVMFKSQCVGDYVADLVVNNQLLVELKCVDKFAPEHMAKCINYLKASRLRVALLINFQRLRVEWKRVLLDQ